MTAGGRYPNMKTDVSRQYASPSVKMTAFVMKNRSASVKDYGLVRIAPSHSVNRNV